MGAAALDQIEDQDLDTIPQSQAAEQGVLGGLMYDNEAYHSVSGFLKSEHFHNPIHALIYETMVSQISKGRLADAIVLKNIFSKNEALAEIGGVEYLAQLTYGAPSAAVAKEYGRLVHKLALRREVGIFAKGLEREAHDPESEKDVLEIVDDAEAALYRLAETGNHRRGFVGFSQSLTETIRIAAAAMERGGGLSGLSTGFKAIDDKLGGLHKSDLIILAGRPSMGKTALATNIAFNVAKSFFGKKLEDGSIKVLRGGRVGFFSLEMSREQLALRILAQEARIPSTAIRKGEVSRNDFDRLSDAVSKIESAPLYIDDTGGLSIGALAARARRLKRVHGLDLIVVDYLQLLNAGAGVLAKNGRVMEVTLITQQLKSIAKELDVPVLALAQLSRQVEQREDKRPQLADLRESGSIEQDADVVAFVFREEYYHERVKPNENSEEFLKWVDQMEQIQGKAEVVIGKQRHGPIGTIDIGFQPTFTQFHDLEG